MIRPVESPILQEFSFSLVTDCHLLVQDLADQKSVPLAEVISLGSQAESLYVTVAIESRRLGQVRQCFELWRDATALFSELHDSWTDVAADDQSIQWLRGRLAHFREMAEDRTSLYNVSESARRVYAKRKAFDSDSEYSFGTRGEIEPVREFSKLETASIERAYRRTS